MVRLSPATFTLASDTVNSLARQAHAAMAAAGWNAVRPLLHPYLHWTDGNGTTTRGRDKVLALLEHCAQPPPEPARTELRDRQIYRWHC